VYRSTVLPGDVGQVTQGKNLKRGGTPPQTERPGLRFDPIYKDSGQGGSMEREVRRLKLGGTREKIGASLAGWAIDSEE